MDFFCVRIKPRHSRGNRNRKGNKKDEEKTSAIQVEARPRVEPVRKKKKPGKQTHRRPRAMAHQCAPADFPAPGKEQQHCPCTYCRSQLVRPPTRNSNCDHERDADQRKPGGPAHETPPHRPQVNQVYVHPYSTYHYRFPVVDHSTTCYGYSVAPYPACYTALVPEAAAVRDIETALAHRPGLMSMARLSATEELVHTNTFHCIRALHEASLQLEVWDSENAASNE